jgi:hypothetical protein
MMNNVVTQLPTHHLCVPSNVQQAFEQLKTVSAALAAQEEGGSGESPSGGAAPPQWADHVGPRNPPPGSFPSHTHPPVAAYKSYLSALSRAGRWGDAFELAAEMEAVFPPSPSASVAGPLGKPPATGTPQSTWRGVAADGRPVGRATSALHGLAPLAEALAASPAAIMDGYNQVWMRMRGWARAE